MQKKIFDELKLKLRGLEHDRELSASTVRKLQGELA